MTKISASRRVALTKRDASSEIGSKLLGVLGSILADGKIDKAEIVSLRSWLNDASKVSDLPGIHFLKEEIAAIVADGRVSEAENRLLVDSALRIVPPTERERLKTKVSEVSAEKKRREKEQARELDKQFRTQQREETKLEREAERKAEAEEASKPTARQLAFITDLGGSCPPNATKWDASDLIDSLLSSRPTIRQQMVLRFWNRLDLMRSGVSQVSIWMDQWYGKDPDHLEAWELWKVEVESKAIVNGTRERIELVPIGSGREYLARIKSVPRRQNRPPPLKSRSISPESPIWTRWIIYPFVAVVVVTLIVLIILQISSSN